ncbi:MAG: hypothetical protein ABW119_22115 [Candidatus Thiodiazotropha lotti]
MNQSQQKLLAMWSFFLVMVTLVIVDQYFTLGIWGWLSWAVPLFVAMFSLWGGKEEIGRGRPGIRLSEINDYYPLLKAWIVFYTIFQLQFIAYGLSQDIEFHELLVTWVLWGGLPLLLPLIGVYEYQHFKQLGQDRDSDKFS